MPRYQVTLTDELAEAVAEIAKAENRSLSNAVAFVVRLYFEQSGVIAPPKYRSGIAPQADKPRVKTLDEVMAELED